jgi:REP element-mobilizing transposase RayT
MVRQRKHLRRLSEVLATDRAPLYYITVCANRRRRLLAHHRVAQILHRTFEDSERQWGWAVGRYVIMPDHVHLFAAPTSPEAPSLSEFMRDWKKWTTRELTLAGHGQRIWQREFFDHLLRSGESYAAKWEYVRHNPVRAKLCEAADAWPYQGEIAILSW